MIKHKNVLLMIADDWSPLAGCYGDTVVSTPHIDSLARQGTVFTQAFCTTPSCAASRANILTGMYSHQHRQFGHSHGCHHFRTREDVRSLPAILCQAGMSSYLCGKSHIAPESAYPFSGWLESRGGAYPLFTKALLVDAVRTALSQAQEGPFYLHVASGYPHRTGGNFDRSVYKQEFSDVCYDPATMTVPPYLPDTLRVRRDLADYYTFVSRFDQSVGEVIAELERSGQRESTLILLLSDHGMPFPGAKASPFEAGHHCPLIIVDPSGRGGGKRCDALVNWCDILPTVLDFMQVPVCLWPLSLTGRSLLSLLENPESEWSDVTYYSHSFHEVTNYFPYRAVRGKRYKYVRCLASALTMPMGADLFDSDSYASVLETGGSPTRSHERLLTHWSEALFDLKQDPFETTNLIGNAGLQGVVADYRKRLTELRQETDDPWLEIDYQEGLLPEYR